MTEKLLAAIEELEEEVLGWRIAYDKLRVLNDKLVGACEATKARTCGWPRVYDRIGDDDGCWWCRTLDECEPECPVVLIPASISAYEKWKQGDER